MANEKLTVVQKMAIEAVLAKGDRVELIPVKDGVRIIKIKRKEVKANERLRESENGKHENTGMRWRET